MIFGVIMELYLVVHVFLGIHNIVYETVQKTLGIEKQKIYLLSRHLELEFVS